jgi:hypothetical protein
LHDKHFTRNLKQITHYDTPCRSPPLGFLFASMQKIK